VNVPQAAAQTSDSDGRTLGAFGSALAWGLLEVPFLVSRIYPNDPDSMRAGFEYFTGRPLLHDGGQGVQLPDRIRFQGGETRPIESGR
jgi:hypothetical protein